jgi:hypothetical protein
MRGCGEFATEMSQIVVDTDVASYIFNWHSSAQRWVDVLRGSELIFSFMSIAEMRRPITEPPRRLDRCDGAGDGRPTGHEQSKRLWACSKASLLSL